MQRRINQSTGQTARAVPVKLVQHTSAPFVSAATVEGSFAAWRQQVAPTGPRRVPPTAALAPRAVTSEEMTAVSLATVRESSTHRHWPKEIVAKFLAAEIIALPATDNAPAKLTNFMRWPLYYLQAKG